jgi:glycosyltransferase involved in cell wall biosynthesis
LPEIIQGSDTRLVPADDPEALACAMALVADDFEAAGKRAERLRSIVKERFTTTRMVRSTLEFYRDALLRISAERAPAATAPSEIYCYRENP